MKFITFNGNYISKLSLGTVQFGLDYGIANSTGKPSQESVDKIIDYVYENGLNCFDTASAYGNSEEVLGEASYNKENIFFISKLKSNFFIDNLNKNVLKSLANLKRDTLYGLLLHDSELLYSWKEEYSLLVDRLIESKKIKYFGVSIYTDEDFNLAIENDSVKFIQIPFNIFDQRAITKGWLEKAKKHNKLIFIRSIFLQGLLLMDIKKLPKDLEKAKKYLRIFEDYSQKLNMSKSELALSFVDSVATESVLLFGCDNIEQAKENIENYNKLKKVESNICNDITQSFKDIDETIYNPTKW